MDNQQQQEEEKKDVAVDGSAASDDAANSADVNGKTSAAEKADAPAKGAEDAPAGNSPNKETQTENPSKEETPAEEPSAEEASSAAPSDKGSGQPPAETAAPAEPDWKEMYARTMADFDNFRKRQARDREELFKSAAKDVLKDVLPSVDDLALALDKAADKEDPFVKGVRLVYDKLVKMLADHGATPIDSLGEPLDTNFHEAIATLPSPEVPEGHVMNEVKRGWLLNGKVLRAAQVVVSSGKGE